MKQTGTKVIIESDLTFAWPIDSEQCRGGHFGFSQASVHLLGQLPATVGQLFHFRSPVS